MIEWSLIYLSLRLIKNRAASESPPIVKPDLADHVNRSVFSNMQYQVMDEAYSFLDMGFMPDIFLDFKTRNETLIRLGFLLLYLR